MMATLNRFNNEALAKFNIESKEVVVGKPMSVNTLQKIKGIHYTRNKGK